jgi:hypothetical protein
MATPIRLYKGGKISGPIYGPVDVAAWIADGWSRDPQPIGAEGLPKIEYADPTPENMSSSILKDIPFVEVDSVVTRESREAELMDMSWQAIKKIADSHGIKKPDDGWDEAIPMILDAEFPSN